MKHILFFATKEDLLPVLELVESKAPLKYTLTGNFLAHEARDRMKVFDSGAEIPDLGKADAESAAACAQFIVCERETPVDIWPFEGRDGPRVLVGPPADSVEFQPGGIWNEEVVISGRVATCSESPVAQALMRRFHAAIKKTFVKVRADYVGPTALALFNNGKRLTAGAQCPREYDLALEDDSTSSGGPRRPMSSEKATRLSYEESCRFLQRLGYPDAGADGVIPPLPDHRPQFDDEEPLGVGFFRTRVCAGDLENLTLPRTSFGKSEIGPVSFRNTDLSESTLCWNDFTDVNFTDADLSGCDLRASNFSASDFVRTNLRNADLRQSNFEACNFTDADMQGAKLTREQGAELPLSVQQQAVIGWQESDGEEPPGG